MKTLQFFAIILTAIAMSAGFAHLLELPNKITLSRDDYLTVQQIYRGWALLGFVILGALALTVVVAVRKRSAGGASFYYTVAAVVCISLSLIVFFSFTFPANQATRNWTMLPEEWESLRTRWEYSHAVGAGLYLLALSALVLSLMQRPRGSADG